jgi:hypothetical protein
MSSIRCDYDGVTKRMRKCKCEIVTKITSNEASSLQHCKYCYHYRRKLRSVQIASVLVFNVVFL